MRWIILMLVLVIKDTEQIRIGKDIIVKATKGMGKDRYKVYIDAPKDLKITREEIQDKVYIDAIRDLRITREETHDKGPRKN